MVLKPGRKKVERAIGMSKREMLRERKVEVLLEDLVRSKREYR